MYIVKNALKCISRSKGRNVLIGIIVLVIAFSACIGLSIRQAAESAKSDALENLSITATISFDRQSMMNEMREQGERPDDMGGEPPSFDRSQFAEKMGESSALTLEEYQTYAEAESVEDFYYTLNASVNGSDDFEAVTSEAESSDDEATESTNTNNQDFGGQTPPDGGSMGGQQGMAQNPFESQGDFQIIGYSGESAMTDFINGTTSITDGAVFEEGTSSLECIISEELATFNELAVGDTVTVTNPKNEDETYELNVVGIYTDTSSNESSFSTMGMTFNDPANQIYMSYTALQSIMDASSTDENTQLTGNLTATYVFADVESYEAFEAQAREMGLDDSYTISSQDITSYENSLAPLKTLSTMAGWFLLVILIIGAIILVVLNIFNVRERKYEIGVLTAMGMKKGKVALQFVTEIFVVTLVAVIIGVSAGAVSSVPVTNALLENQISSQQSQAEQVEQNFGRGGMQGGMHGGEMPEDMGDKGFGMGDIFGKGGAEYITEINSAMNFTVVLQMLGIAVLLTLITGAVSMLFVMRYEPLKILANRD